MKNQIILKSFLMLALIFAFSSLAHASEVTGTLASANGSSSTVSSSSSSGTISGQTISGTVSGSTSSSTSGGGGSVGPVLGASTIATNYPVISAFSDDGMAFNPGVRSVSTGSETSTLAQTTPPGVAPRTSVFDPSTQTATAIGAFSGFNAGTWFWIILLLLLLAVVIISSYNRSQYKNKAYRV
jgi:hypothetical protein